MADILLWKTYFWPLHGNKEIRHFQTKRTAWKLCLLLSVGESIIYKNIEVITFRDNALWDIGGVTCIIIICLPGSHGNTDHSWWYYARLFHGEVLLYRTCVQPKGSVDNIFFCHTQFDEIDKNTVFAEEMLFLGD